MGKYSFPHISKSLKKDNNMTFEDWHVSFKDEENARKCGVIIITWPDVGTCKCRAISLLG